MTDIESRLVKLEEVVTLLQEEVAQIARALNKEIHHTKGDDRDASRMGSIATKHRG